MPRVKPFTRKGGEKVRGKERKKPILSAEEKKRRARVAKKELIPAAIKAAGRAGFEETKEKLVGKPGMKSPEKLAGWLKARSKERGQLSPKHPYVGRRKRRE